MERRTKKVNAFAGISLTGIFFFLCQNEFIDNVVVSTLGEPQSRHTKDGGIVVWGNVLGTLDLNVAIEGVETDLEEEADSPVHGWGHVGVGAPQTRDTLLAFVCVMTICGDMAIAVGMTICEGGVVSRSSLAKVDHWV